MGISNSATNVFRINCMNAFMSSICGFRRGWCSQLSNLKPFLFSERPGVVCDQPEPVSHSNYLNNVSIFQNYLWGKDTYLKHKLKLTKEI